jgi:DNA ligase-1
MVSPAKRRKLNGNSEPSPTSTRNLDFFFRKQTQKLSAGTSHDQEQETQDQSSESELTDEQLARLLQAEWDREAANNGVTNQSPKAVGVLDSSGPPSYADIQRDERADWTSGNSVAYRSAAPDLKPQVLHEGPKSNTTLSLQSTGSAEGTVTSNIPFDESPVIFEPAKYVADLQSIWAAEGGNASYALLTRCFVLVNSTQSRIKIVDTLVNLLRLIIEGDPSSLLPTVRTVIAFCQTP